MNMSGSNIQLTDSKRVEFPASREIMQFEAQVNSNDFNAFELHSITKSNSLYFMMQYMNQKFDFEE